MGGVGLDIETSKEGRNSDTARTSARPITVAGMIVYAEGPPDELAVAHAKEWARSHGYTPETARIYKDGNGAYVEVK